MCLSLMYDNIKLYECIYDDVNYLMTSWLLNWLVWWRAANKMLPFLNFWKLFISLLSLGLFSMQFQEKTFCLTEQDAIKNSLTSLSAPQMSFLSKYISMGWTHQTSTCRHGWIYVIPGQQLSGVMISKYNFSLVLVQFQKPNQ